MKMQLLLLIAFCALLSGCFGKEEPAAVNGATSLGIELLEREQTGNTRIIGYTGGQFLGNYDGSIRLSDSGLVWENLPAIEGTLRAFVVTSSGLSIAGGDDGKLIRSKDGKSWSEINSGITEDIRLLQSSEHGEVMAATSNGEIWYSPDGDQWARVHTTKDGRTPRAIKYGSGSWILITASGAIDSSSGPVGWKEVLSERAAGRSRLRAVSFSGSQWLAVGIRGTVYSSSDGIEWANHSTESLSALAAVQSIDGTWVAMSTNQFFRSVDGKRWNPGPKLEGSLLDFAYADGEWRAVGRDGAVLASADGMIWNPAPRVTNERLIDVFKSAKGWIAIGARSALLIEESLGRWAHVQGALVYESVFRGAGVWIASGPGGLISTSTDGREWKSFWDVEGRVAFAAAAGPDKAIVVGERGAAFSVSTKGVVEPILLSEAADLNDVQYSNGRWVIAGSKLLVSEDGATWEEPTLSFEGNLYLTAVESDGRKWVSVGPSGIFTSEDGKKWAKAEVDGKYRSIAYAVGRWLAVGEEGSSASSEDGTRWTALSSDKAENWLSAAGSGIGLVAVSQSSIEGTSDGVLWTRNPVSLGERDDVQVNVAFDGKRWILTNQSDVVHFSENGSFWTSFKANLTVLSFAAAGDNAATPNVLVLTEEGWAQLVQDKVLPVIKSVEHNWIGDKLSVNVVGDMTQCKNPSIVVLGQLEKTHAQNGVGLRVLAQKTDFPSTPDAERTLTLPFDWAAALGVHEGEAYFLSTLLNCNGWIVSHPRYSNASTHVYAPRAGVVDAAGPPALAAGAILGSVLLVFWLRPALILRIRLKIDGLGALGQITLPWLKLSAAELLHILNFGLVPALAKTDRVVYAWVQQNSDTWRRDGLEATVTAQRSRNYLQLPVRIGDPTTGELIEKPSPEDVLRLIAEKRGWLEIVGVGGAGKTMLMIQMARWLGDAQTASSRFHCLPILIEEDIASASELIAVLRRKLFAVLGDTLDEPTIRTMLRLGRIIPLFDRLSERSEATILAISKIQGSVVIRRAIITLRHSLSYEGLTPARVFPLPLRTTSLMAFMAGLLRDAPSDAHFDRVASQVDLAHRLMVMITIDGRELPLTPLVVKIFVDRAVQLARTDASLSELPKSIPEAYFEYMRAVNPKDEGGPHVMTDEAMLKAARLVAVAALGNNYIPKALDSEAIRPILESAGWTRANGDVDPIERLRLNGVLVQRFAGSRVRWEFALDPVAEYLAADEYLIRLYGDVAALKLLLSAVESAGMLAKGFYGALVMSAAQQPWSRETSLQAQAIAEVAARDSDPAAAFR